MDHFYMQSVCVGGYRLECRKMKHSPHIYSVKIPRQCFERGQSDLTFSIVFDRCMVCNVSYMNKLISLTGEVAIFSGFADENGESIEKFLIDQTHSNKFFRIWVDMYSIPNCDDKDYGGHQKRITFEHKVDYSVIPEDDHGEVKTDYSVIPENDHGEVKTKSNLGGCCYTDHSKPNIQYVSIEDIAVLERVNSIQIQFQLL
nr:TPA_asm: hypothetical protein [Ladona dragonfly adintovirus]